MPLYEYRCEDCGRDDERLQPMGADPPEEGCRACGGALRRRYSRVAVRYEAWGFGATDTLVREPGRQRFRDVRERAERISEGE